MAPRTSSARRRRASATSRSDRGPRIALQGEAGAVATSLRRAARHVLRRHGVRAGRLEVAVVGDAAMKRTHREWMSDGRSTDVLTFDLRDEPDGRLVDGLILVCRDEARRQARALGRRVADELALYVVHGCLHLVGFDDRRPADFRRMHEREDRMLAELGVPPARILPHGASEGPRR